jgi:hypothetical protein
MNENLVEVFRQRRDVVNHSLLQLASFRHDYRSARQKTGECREMIYSYLKRQDEQFYAKLSSFYQENRPALKIIEFLTLDTKGLKVQTFSFFEKYGTANTLEQGRNFARDLREYMQLLSNRFRLEEDYLVPLLKRMTEHNEHWLAGK